MWRKPAPQTDVNAALAGFPGQVAEAACPTFGALIEEVRFAADSPLEGKGFEPSVPLWVNAVRQARVGGARLP